MTKYSSDQPRLLRSKGVSAEAQEPKSRTPLLIELQMPVSEVPV